MYFPSDQISRRVFEMIKSEIPSDALLPEETSMSRLDASVGSAKVDGCLTTGCLDKTEVGNHLDAGKDGRTKSVPFQLNKRRMTIVVRRESFLDVVCDALAEYKYVGPNQRADLILACRYINILYLLRIYLNLFSPEEKLILMESACVPSAGILFFISGDCRLFGIISDLHIFHFVYIFTSVIYMRHVI